MPWSPPTLVDDAWCFARLELSPDARAYLSLVTQLGHLDGPVLEAFFQDLSPACACMHGERRVLERDELRRLLAVHLFQVHDQLSREQQELLHGEWPLLFG